MAHTSIRLRKRGGRCIRFSAVSIRGDGTDRDGDGRNCPRRRAGEPPGSGDRGRRAGGAKRPPSGKHHSADGYRNSSGFRRRQPPPGNDAGKSRRAGNRDRRSDGCGRGGDRSRDGQCVSADTNRLKEGSRYGEYIRELDSDSQYELIRELLEPEFGAMFVTPQDMDERICKLSAAIAEGIRRAVERLEEER